VTDDTPDAEEAALEKEEQERLWNAISSLPAGLKEPLLLRTMEGLSTAETAELLGTTAKAIEGRMYRARARLAEILGST
jgi:RNA polymerase sigma-70 factor (ECF subfamily)